jgi:hypothetical protein
MAKRIPFRYIYSTQSEPLHRNIYIEFSFGIFYDNLQCSAVHVFAFNLARKDTFTRITSAFVQNYNFIKPFVKITD